MKYLLEIETADEDRKHSEVLEGLSVERLRDRVNLLLLELPFPTRASVFDEGGHIVFTKATMSLPVAPDD